MPLEKHSAQLVGGDTVDLLDSAFVPAAGISQTEWRELVRLAIWFTVAQRASRAPLIRTQLKSPGTKNPGLPRAHLGPHLVPFLPLPCLC